jgi:hypothetical protein
MGIFDTMKDQASDKMDDSTKEKITQMAKDHDLSFEDAKKLYQQKQNE